MIERIRYIWQLLLLSSILLLSGILLFTRLQVSLSLPAFFSMLGTFTLINLVAWLMMYRGISKGKRDGAVIMLAGIGGKFLLYLVYILVFWLLTKNISKAFIITFFALYLIFTFFVAGHLLKVLNNK